MDALTLVERAYAPGLSDREWLSGVVDALPWLGPGSVGVGYALDLSDLAKPQIGEAIVTDSKLFDPAMVAPAHGLLPPDDLRKLYGRRVTTAISTLGAKHPLVQQVLEAQGFQDGAALVALDASRRGVNLAVLTPRPVELEARATGVLERLGAHAAAAWRLRRAYADAEREEAAEAILDPDGRLQHAKEPAKAREARDRLRSFARTVDRARTSKGRKDSSDAVAAWTALVEGRWSMVDHFDRDGRRFCIFLRNDPTLEHLRPLTDLQRQVVALAALGLPNKLIAYELGLQPSRVATDLRRGMSKLGVRNRVELIRMLGFLEPGV